MTSLHTSCSPSGDINALRSQFRMTHTFHLSVGIGETIAGELESTFKSSKARIEKWVITRRGGCYDHSVTVDGIGEESARELRRDLAGINGRIKVNVEHMLHFGSQTGRPA